MSTVSGEGRLRVWTSTDRNSGARGACQSLLSHPGCWAGRAEHSGEVPVGPARPRGWVPPASRSGMKRLKVGLSEGDEAHPPSAPRFPPQRLPLRRSRHFLGVFHHPIANVFH